MRLGSFLAAAGAAALVFSASAASAQTFTETLDPAGTTMTAFFGTGMPCKINTNVQAPRVLKTVTVNIPTSGLYMINDLLGSPGISDGALGLYRGTFYPSDPVTNCVATVGDTLTTSLTAGAYTAVLTKYDPNQPGYQVGFSFTPVPAAIPTLTEWAMILLGVALAGGAALMIQRRRMA